MNVIMAAITAWAPTIMQLASNDDVQTNTFVQNIVKWGAGVGGGIIALFLIYAIVKDGIAYAKGGGSIFPIIGKVLFLLLCIGLIFLALNYTNIGKQFRSMGNKAVNIVVNQANQIND